MIHLIQILSTILLKLILAFRKNWANKFNRSSYGKVQQTTNLHISKAYLVRTAHVGKSGRTKLM